MEKRHRHPFAVTLTAWGVLILGAGYSLGVLHAIFTYSTIESLPLSVPAWYFPLSGAVWGGVWLALGIGLRFGKEWSRRAALVAIPICFCAWMADERLLSRSATALQSFGFEAVLRLILAAIGVAFLIGAGPLEHYRPNPAALGRDLSMEKTTTHVE
ncbi:MAG: hypothetical protein ABSC61_02335 [Anaerolineales bacterium]